MKRAWRAFGVAALLFVFACGGDEAPPDDQIPPWEDPESSMPAPPEGPDGEIGEVEQAASVLLWQIASSNVYGGRYVACSCGSIPPAWGPLYQQCSPYGATTQICWRYSVWPSTYCFVYTLQCLPYYY